MKAREKLPQTRPIDPFVQCTALVLAHCLVLSSFLDGCRLSDGERAAKLWLCHVNALLLLAIVSCSTTCSAGEAQPDQMLGAK